LDKVPKTDKDGIAYTKIQIKRMVKRVKRGLDPVPTEEEERERKRQIRLDKQEEEQELAGMLYTKKEDEEKELEEEPNENEKEDDDNNNDDDDDDDDDDVEMEEKEAPQVKKKVESSENIQKRPKKKARTKEVPADYVCSACNNKHKPLHWIYDCPYKVNKPGTNKKKKHLRGIHDPASHKVFISGLPFDVKAKEVEMYFEKEKKCGKVVNCRLMQFEDTKRCKGTGFLTFESETAAKAALKLNGTLLSWPSSDDEGSKKKKSGGDKKKVKKELRLGVKKLLNRTVTKNKSGYK
jgi:hypothetical protein